MSARLATIARLCSSQNPSHAPDALTVHTWSVAQRGNILEAGYGSGSDFPQYAALHTDSSYLRLNYGPGSEWGTSIILLPSFWEAGKYYQGAPITVAWRSEGVDLVILFTGSISGLQVRGQIRLTPPAPNLISGAVMVQVHGKANLDHRPGEAFKPVALSSMHISVDCWDVASAQVDLQSFRIPARGWIIRPPAIGRVFALRAGSSSWKTKAPTLEIELDEGLEITGWKTDSFNPNDDNLSLWAASDRVIHFWQYSFTAKP
jgi:hypothetical protein